MKKKSIIASLIILAVLLLDQGVKLWVKSTMIEGESLHVFNWFYIHFAENSGMAFSMELPGSYGKIALSVFRLFAIAGIGYWVVDLIRKNAPIGLVCCAAGIFAGATGNLLDSAFYGLIFTDSYGRVAELFPAQGYAGFLLGNVVDMLYFPLIHGKFPTWLPIWGGEYFEFFRPIFNVADSAITVSVAMMLLFQKRFFAE
ncbi:MAG TPA: lipoprotein signal peptidase [Chitinophagales bacterium]